MPIWFVKATWIEDEAEATEHWEVNASTVAEAVKEVTALLPFHPHHVEARRPSRRTAPMVDSADLPLGQARRIPAP